VKIFQILKIQEMGVLTMKKIASRLGFVIAILLSLVLTSFSVEAADYPTKPVTFICPMAAGGEGDLHIRAFASSAEKILGQPIVVVNKTGAAGMIGLQVCASAPPDGYTLALSANVFLLPIEWEIANGRKPLTTLDDFISVGAFGQGLFVIAVPYDSPWKTLGDLIQAGKTKPGQYVFASGGINHPSHIAVEMLMKVAGEIPSRSLHRGCTIGCCLSGQTRRFWCDEFHSGISSCARQQGKDFGGHDPHAL
jgi:tripartite-type tricarboxylate transporter receptor subunit TctC